MHIHDVVKLLNYNYIHIPVCMAKSLMMSTSCMVLFAPCVDDNTLPVIIHVNSVLRLLLYLHMHTGMCHCNVSPHHEYACMINLWE